MWRNKKLVLMAMLATLILVGTISGVVLAQDETGDQNQCEDRYGALLERVAGIYEANTGVAIDAEALRDAFSQAQSDMRAEAMQEHLQSLVDQGTINQEEADQYIEWWQSRPDVTLASPCGPGFGGNGFGFHGRMMR